MAQSKIKQWVPPVLWEAMKVVRAKLAPNAPALQLFQGEAQLFTDAIKGADVYFEFGVGQSTKWVDAHTDAAIFAVDSSSVWIRKVRAELTRPEDHRIDHVDLGPLGKWGTPLSYAHRSRFIDYIEGPWRHGAEPDLVLVDGRFRVACFLTALIKAPAGCKIIFDDYVGRRHYEVVEEVLEPAAVGTRQACFEVPASVDTAAILRLRDAFLMVRD